MTPARHQVPLRAAIYLLALAGLVHAATLTCTAQIARDGSLSFKPGKRVQSGERGTTLPPPVIEMREAILAAARSGAIDEIRTPIEMNEIAPIFANGPVPDPVAYLKRHSADGEGREVLAAIAAILEAPFVAVPAGRDIENNAIYVWPYLAERDLRALTPAEEADLIRIVPAADAARMKVDGKYRFWRLGIGADGVWHFLVRDPP